MKINKAASRNKKVLIATVIVILAAIGGLCVMRSYQNKISPTSEVPVQNKTDLEAPSKNQTNAGATAKNDFDSRTTEASQEKQAANGTESTPPDSRSVETIISSSNVNGNTLSIRSIIQTIDGSGTCSLTLSKSGSQDIRQSAGTRTMGSYTTCAGFDIDTLSMGKGDWQIKLTYTGSNGQSGSATKMVKLQ